jgi:hypothetical protein
VTYPDAAVIEHLNTEFIPTKLLGAEHRDITKELNFRWFPGIAVLDAKGRATHTSVGFLPPADLFSELNYGRAIHAMTTRNYETANRLFQTLADDTTADRAPEATYWWGISKMRETKDPASALEPWTLVTERWPKSQWSRKVEYALKQR